MTAIEDIDRECASLFTADADRLVHSFWSTVAIRAARVNRIVSSALYGKCVWRVSSVEVEV